jgi:hypothetical protein
MNTNSRDFVHGSSPSCLADLAVDMAHSVQLYVDLQASRLSAPPSGLRYTKLPPEKDSTRANKRPELRGLGQRIVVNLA